MSEKISLYNPRDTPPEQLEAMLTGREPLLKEILDSLREQVDAPTRQHWLLRGPRGIGKTHLTGIIHHRIQGDPALSRAYLPLWLGEADVYEVYSPATLLLRICERLVEAIPEAELTQKLRTLEGGGDEDLLFEELTSLLTEEAERQGRVLIVLMENLDALFESFAPKQRTEQTRQLRSLLLGNPRFLFVSTTPTRYLKELSDPKAPLFAQLKERKLNPLKVQEVGALFTKLTQFTGRKELLGQGSEASLKQRIIHQLTGGLPRSVVMAFEILRDREGIQVLVEDLRAFLDAQTAYFEARLSRLAPRERSIVTTLALADQNLTIKELSAKSLLPEKSLSTHVSRLEQEGHVEAMDGTGGKGTLYGLSEGLFRIWYQYRKGRLLLEPLVRFLAYWYEPEELQGVVDTMKQRPLQQVTGPGRAVKLALIQVEAAFQLATSEHGRIERRRLWEECRQAMEESAAQTPTELSPALKRELAQGVSLLVSGKEQQGRALLEEVLAKQGSLPKKVAIATIQFLYSEYIKVDEDEVSSSPELLSWIIDYFGKSPEPSIIQFVWMVQIVRTEILRGLNRIQEASTQIEDLLTWLTRQEVSWFSHIMIGAHHSRAMLLYAQERHAEALTAFEEILSHTRNNDSPLVRQYRVYTLTTLADLYRLAMRPQEEQLSLQQLLSEPIDSPTRRVRLMVALAKLRLICFEIQEAQFDIVKVNHDIEEWFVEHQDIVPMIPPEHFEGFALIRRMLAEALKGDVFEPSDETIRSIFRLGISNNPLPLSIFFLNHISMVIQRFPAKETRTWVEQLLLAKIPETHKQQLRLHLQLLELLESASNRSSEAQVRLRQQLGRVTIEFQALFKKLLSKLG